MLLHLSTNNTQLFYHLTLNTKSIMAGPVILGIMVLFFSLKFKTCRGTKRGRERRQMKRNSGMGRRRMKRNSRIEQGKDEDGANHHNDSKALCPLSSSSSSKLKKKVKENGGSPCDVLEVICKKLDIDDLFQFAGVCKDWRTCHKSYMRKFMVSQAPLLIHTSYANETYFFVSLCEQKIYSAKMDYFWGYSYAGFSCGYVIMARANNTLLLLNPFTRRKKEISVEAFQRSIMPLPCHAILAYGKDSEELIVVLLCKKTWSLYIYQSRNSCWATYMRFGEPWRVVDSVVFHHTVYVITNEAKIGVLSLNSTTLKFLELNNVPSITSSNLKLVSSNGNLLVVHFEHEKFEVFKIDFSSMESVKLKTLGDVTLFYSMRTKCYALSNPGMWGYEKNCVYYIDQTSSLCKVYSMDNKWLPSIFPGGTQAPAMSSPYWSDWCFLHIRDEVDYSLVE